MAIHPGLNSRYLRKERKNNDIFERIRGSYTFSK